jgi:hypothetical protein
VHNYGKIAVSLVTLIKKNALSGNNVVEWAFQNLKEVTCTTLILTISDFVNNFILECDAQDKGIGEDLMQEGHLLTLSSIQLFDKNFDKSNNEK